MTKKEKIIVSLLSAAIIIVAGLIYFQKPESKVYHSMSGSVVKVADNKIEFMAYKPVTENDRTFIKSFAKTAIVDSRTQFVKVTASDGSSQDQRAQLSDIKTLSEDITPTEIIVYTEVDPNTVDEFNVDRVEIIAESQSLKK
ncbi:MAG TPA: hypothetical protein VD770_00585 [Coxiellaceae bacterium]|nr:hypothetical protein [Coxiellaceae bacterium]